QRRALPRLQADVSAARRREGDLPGERARAGIRALDHVAEDFATALHGEAASRSQIAEHLPEVPELHGALRKYGPDHRVDADLEHAVPSVDEHGVRRRR